MALFGLLDAAHGEASRSARLVPRLSAPLKFVFEQGQMRGDFAVQIGIGAIRPDQIRQPTQKPEHQPEASANFTRQSSGIKGTPFTVRSVRL